MCVHIIYVCVCIMLTLFFLFHRRENKISRNREVKSGGIKWKEDVSGRG